MFYPGGVAIAVFLNLLLLSKRNKTLADKILAAWLLVISLHLLLFYFYETWLYPELLGAALPLPLIHGPLLYIYTIALTTGNFSLRSAIIHFIPAIAVYIYLIPFFALPTEEKIFVFKNNGIGYETFSRINSLAIIASGIFYVIVSSLALRRHRASIVNQFSSTEKISLQWLQYLIYWIGAIWFLVIFANDDWVFGAVVLFILFIGFFGIRQVGIFNPTISPTFKDTAENTIPVSELETVAVDKVADRPKYMRSGLTTDQAEMLHRSLNLLMREQKVFREGELSLAELANRLNTLPNYLSQVINEREGKNFYDYINTIRIEEFKRLAVSPDSRKYTLLALAQECGFNSKSSFNRYFKKVAGMSPSEYLDQSAQIAN